jgi:1,4-alpha-glucan branching enzyme
VYAFLRTGSSEDRPIAVVCNFTPEIRRDYRVGLPMTGRWREALNTDAAAYGGSNVGNFGAISAEGRPMHGFSSSAALTLPPLATVFLEYDPVET